MKLSRTAILLHAVVAFAACKGDDPEATADAGAADMSVDTAMMVDLAGADDVVDQRELIDNADSAADMSVAIQASNYCELTVDFFCDYYMRCGRIAARSVDDCREIFTETCNAVYEPIYAAYEAAGLLALSADGIDSCREHLAAVDCDQQVQDLDQGCSQMWVGQAAPQDACAIGIGSFVCQPGSTCRVGLDFCGTCELAGQPGDTCNDGQRCTSTAECIDGTCEARALPNEPCDDTTSCITGIACVDNLCQPRNIVAVGDPCDQGNRCPYKSACLGGVCVEAALQGESCANTTCASGYCDGAICQPLRGESDDCGDNQQCVSGVCDAGKCAGAVSACLL